ncbi:hypothetical protein J7K99_01120 [bacterium]|nr:hypothetical protein [bacterium]
MNRRELIGFAALFVIVFISRLPFLSPGFGTDEDGWRTIKAARDLAITGAYHYSRKPCFPVLEYVYSWIWDKNPSILNGITALFSAVAVVFFAVSVRKHRIGSPFWAGLIFAFSPVVYIASTTTMDYMWAMAFIMVSYYLLINRKHMFSALFLGIATGCRISSAAITLPFAIMTFVNEKDRHSRILDIAAFMGITAIVTIIFYYPIYTIYGKEMFKFPVGGRPLPSELSQLFGNLGFAAITLSVFISSIIQIKTDCKKIIKKFSKNTAKLWLTIVIIYTILYLDMPHEPGYLIPALPFAIMFILPLINKNLFKLATLCVIISSFVDIYPNGISAGHLLVDHRNRNNLISHTNKVIKYCKDNIQNAVIITNYYTAPLDILGNNVTQTNNIIFKYKLTSEQAPFFKSVGYIIYYLPSIKNRLKPYQLDKFSQPLPLPQSGS